MYVESVSPQERFAELLRSDQRYHPEAYSFIFEALDYAVRMKSGSKAAESGSTLQQHVTGQDLLEGMRRYALESFGCLAYSVITSWGIQSTEDVGEMVFNLVDHGLMGKQESDTKEDFANGFGGLPFLRIFQARPVFQYIHERDEWRTTYESTVLG